MPTATVNIPSQLVIKTSAEWAVDSTVYGENYLLITSDEFYTGNARKIKTPNGIDEWANLDYLPLSGAIAFADITGDPYDNTNLSNALNAKADQSDLASHTSNTSNPHNVTKTQVGLGNVPNLDTSTTTNITDSSNKRFITDAQQTVLGNTSGTNTGDETAARIGAIINGTTNYTTPLDADKIGIWDTLNSLFKYVTWTNLKATLASTFYLDATSSIQTQLNSKRSILSASFFGGSAIFNPADSLYYYLRYNTTTILTSGTSTAPAGSHVRAPHAFTSVVVSMFFDIGSLGTTETVTINVLNTTSATSQALTSQNFGTSRPLSSIDQVSLTGNAGDLVTVQGLTPAFSTNPTNVYWQYNLIFIP